MLVETILRAPHVEVQVRTPTLDWAQYRLQGREAFQYLDTGEEERSLDWTTPWPEPVFAFLPCSRAEVEQTLLTASTVVLEVDYRT